MTQENESKVDEVENVVENPLAKVDEVETKVEESEVKGRDELLLDIMPEFNAFPS